MASAQDAVVDLTTSPPLTPTAANPSDPFTSLSTLGTILDSYSTDVPGFVNSLISLPPTAAGAPASAPDLTPIDKTLNDLLTRLSLLSQDTSSALEQSIHDITRTVPRLTYDLQFMRESATSLQSSLSLVQSQMKGPGSTSTDNPESKTFNHLEKLSHLDKLKGRMESARDILREAESWSTLENEVTSLIEQSAWDKAGVRLAEAKKSMVVFQSTPGEYESRRTLLVSLQNELERALAGALEKAIGEGDVENIAKLRPVFEMIERSEEFKEYYFKSKGKSIVEEWNSAVILDTTMTIINEDTTAVKYNVFLPRFYTSLLEVLQLEKTQISRIFPPHSAVHTLSSFIQSTLERLSPSPRDRLSSLSEHHGAAGLPEVIRAYRATEELALAIQGVLDTMAFNTQGGLVSGSAVTSSPTSASPTSISAESKMAKSSKRTMSRRFSRAPTTLSEVPVSSPAEWETTLYEPFLDLQGSYPSLERRYLSQLLRTESSLSSISSKGDASRSLLDRATAALGFADEAIARCLSFTHGYGAKGLVDALNGFFEDFMDTQRDRVLTIGKIPNGKNETKDELDFDGLDYSTEDWGAFQLGLHVLSACKDIRDRLGKFEIRLNEALGHAEQVSKIQPSDPRTFTLQETTLGAITLLQQSPLNSANLHALLSAYTSNPTLAPSRDALTSFTREAQLFLQGIILAPLQAQLKEYPALSVWSQPDKASRRGDLHVPTFSLSPTDTMTRVSEGLLNLLRVFEVYAADDALAFGIDTLPFVEKTVLSEAGQASPGGSIGSETVLSTWVSSLSLSLLSQMTGTTLKQIKSLSTSGAAQLASDLAYLSNAVRALDVEWEDLERWKEAAGVESQEEFKNRLKEVTDKGEHEIWSKVGSLRGWI